MKTIKVRGLVLKEIETGEADKRLLLLCKGQGKILAYARGARKPKSKFIAAAQVFTYADFVLAEGRGFYSVAQAEVIESFYDLRTDYDRLLAAHQIVDICEKTLWEAQNCDELLLLALKSLSNLSKGKFPPAQTAVVFMVRFFCFYGLRPNTDFCAVCGEKIIFADAPELSWGKEGLICEKHEFYPDSERMQISNAAAIAISFILGNELSAAFRFEAREDVLAEVKKATGLLWRYHFESES